MESSQQQTFVVRQDIRNGLLLAILCGAGMATILSVMLCLQSSPSLFITTLSIGLVVFFGGGAAYLFYSLRNFPKLAVSVDDDGIWLEHFGKERGLIPWDAIRDAREPWTNARLDLLGDKQQVLIKLEYLLGDFEKLQSLVASRMLGEDELGVYPRRFSKSWPEHSKAMGLPMLIIAVIVGFVFYGAYAYLVFAILALPPIVSYLFAPYQLVLHEHHLETRSLVRSRRIQRDEVVSVALKTTRSHGATASFVLLELKDGSEVPLSNLGRSTIRLSRALMVWKYLPDEVGVEE